MGVARRVVVATLVLALTGGAVAACGRGRGQLPVAAPISSAAPPITSQPAPAPLRAGERFVTLTMPRPYTPAPPAGGTDEYRCFLVDPQLAEPAFVTGSQFLPVNAAIVHHAIFFRVDPGDVEQARQLDRAEAGDGWRCFGGTGIGAGQDPGVQLRGGGGWIAAWAPGGREGVLADQTGFRLQAGSQLVMQIHYNLLATGGRSAGTDQSGIRLRMVAGTANVRPLQTALLPAPVELPCPPTESGSLCDREHSVLDVWRRFGEHAGATVAGLNLLCNGGRTPVPGPTQQCDHRVKQAGTVYAVAGHMHLLGRSIKVELNPGTPGARTLLDVPAYDFDDQGSRALAAPVAVKAGDVYRVTCTHDASLRTQLPELKPLQPRYVVWGEGTSDEMCLGIVTWTAP